MYVCLFQNLFNAHVLIRNVFQPTAPSGPPQFLNVSSATLSDITIEWKEIDCLKRNGPITKYLVSYKGNELMREQQVTGLSFTAAGLQPRANYKITVKGFCGLISLNPVLQQQSMPIH